MILSEVVKFKNLLDGISIDPAAHDAVRHLASILHVITEQPIRLAGVHEDLETNLNQVKDSIASFDRVVVDLNRKLQAMIDTYEPALYASSQRVYEEEMCYEPNDYVLNRRLAIDPDSDIALRARLKRYTDWRLPGMIIRPARENFVEVLVPLDPLYLVDHNEELLAPAVSAFTPEYQRRLRTYTVNDYRGFPAMLQLPSNQFGLIFAYNYFNYKPMNVIQQYLQEMFDKLRPGGVLLFTYNNCNRWHGVALAEKSFMSYVPGRRLRINAEFIGYEITHQYDGEGDLSWIELKKPGEIVSLRGGQSVAKIIANPQ
jgi:SAM-dependent methyltransferase